MFERIVDKMAPISPSERWVVVSREHLSRITGKGGSPRLEVCGACNCIKVRWEEQVRKVDSKYELG